MAVCLRCDRQVPADPMRTFYCYCRSDGGADGLVTHLLDSAPAAAAA